MDLKSGYPYWAVKNGLMQAFPPLDRDASTDIAIVGGGITGALIADALQKAGHQVIVVEQRDIGWGSTAASTALLQYEIDTHMVDLARQYGEEAALLAYRSCEQSIPALHKLAKGVRDVDFASMSSLYYASKRRHRRDLAAEFAMREKHGFKVEWLEPADLQSRYGLSAPAGILSDTAARIDPYRMAYKLFARVSKNGGGVHDRCQVDAIDPGPRNVRLKLGNGHLISARHVVLAAGYANARWLPKRIARNRSSYAFITDPIANDVLGPLAHTMVWESARPYLYLRSTGDGRLLVGGDDDSIDIPARRDARVEKKVRALSKRCQQLFPHIDWTPTFSWGGTFAETDDGLPFFGPHPALGPRVHFAMAYGGNGITYSMIGAELLVALIEKRRHPLQSLFGFDRID